MARTPGMLRLRITHPDGSTRDCTARADHVLVGSGPAAEVRLPDPAVSMLHVMLKLQRDDVMAIDLASDTGTSLGGTRLGAPVVLKDGDVLRLGQSQLTVLFAPAEERTPASPPRARPLNGFGVIPPAPRVPPGLRTRGSAALSVVPEPERLAPPLPVPPSRPPGRAEASLWRLLTGPLPGSAAPTDTSRVLQASLVWGDQVLAVEHLGPGVPVTLGASRRNLFAAFDPALGKSFRLAREDGGRLVVSVPQGGELTVFRNGGEVSAEALRNEGRIRQWAAGVRTFEPALREAVRVRVGPLAVLVRWVRPAPKVPIREADGVERHFLTILGTSFVAAVVLLFVIHLVPAPGSGTREGLEDQANYVRLIVRTRPPAVPKKVAAKEENSSSEEGKKAEDEEGKLGKPEALKAEAEPSKPGSPLLDEKRREEARRKVLSAGLLGAVGRNKDAASNLFGPGGLGTGINAARGGLRAGAGVGEARGALGGSGSRGLGTGGGGGAGLGIGGVGTRGLGEGGGGYGRIELGGKQKDTVRVVPGRTVVVGGLSRDVIARVIQQHQSEIKYCYESELNRNPSLAGKVAVGFTIAGTGAVSEAVVNESTLGDTNTEQCMLNRIRRWKFPEPVGGGIVTVTFPWVFRPAGAGE